MGVLSRCCSGKRPHLALRGESLGVSRVVTGNLGFLLSCDRDLKPACVASGKSSPIQVARGLSEFPCSQCRGTQPYLELRPEPQGFSPVLTWILRFLWSFNSVLRPRLVWRHGTPLSSRGVKWLSGFLSSGHRGQLLFLKVPRGFHTSLRILS